MATLTDAFSAPSGSCLLCEGDSLRYVFQVQGHPMHECHDCGFMFLNPQPAADVLGAIPGSPSSRENESEGDRDCGSATASGTARILLDQLLCYHGKADGRLLHVGSAADAFPALAKESGFDVQCVNISEPGASPADVAPLPHGLFDVCVLSDAIQRTRRPLTLLRNVHEMLRPDGVLVLVMPSLDSWPARVLKDGWPEFKIDHLQYFDTQTIQNALAKTGFQKIRITRPLEPHAMARIGAHVQGHRPTLSARIFAAAVPLLPATPGRVRLTAVTSRCNVFSRKTVLKSKPCLSIIVPIYNEVSTFKELMASLVKKEFPDLDREIVIVDGNSTDGTREEALRYSGASGVTVILEERPRGKGRAVRTGLNAATGDFVIIQDGDLEYDLNDYDALLAPLLHYRKAFVLGSRHLRGWKMRHFSDQPLVSFIVNCGQVFFTALLNLFCGSRLRDPFTMYKVFRRDCVYGLTLKANRFDFDWELVIKLLRKGYRPLEIPVNYHSRSFRQGKKVSFFRDPLTWVWALVRFRFERLFESE